MSVRFTIKILSSYSNHIGSTHAADAQSYPCRYRTHLFEGFAAGHSFSVIHHLYDSANIRTMSSSDICTRSAVNMMPITSRVLRMKVSNSSGVMP